MMSDFHSKQCDITLQKELKKQHQKNLKKIEEQKLHEQEVEEIVGASANPLL